MNAQGLLFENADSERRDRLDNGSKARMDHGGDAWANEHRSGLPRFCYMTDFDAICGSMAFQVSSANKMFVENVVLADQKSNTLVRSYATVALFERKATLFAAEDPRNAFQTAYYLDLCRKIALQQSEPPRFFFAIGTQEPPWTMIEIDIVTGERIPGHFVVASNGINGWEPMWRAAGLFSLRERLRTSIITAER